VIADFAPLGDGVTGIILCAREPAVRVAQRPWIRGRISKAFWGRAESGRFLLAAPASGVAAWTATPSGERETLEGGGGEMAKTDRGEWHGSRVSEGLGPVRSA
jgi:hypothetical protein